MDESPANRRHISSAEKRDKSIVSRPRRQPTRTLIAGLLWVFFMLAVWFQAPGVRLPIFFQRLVGIVDALLSMLVVMFAIREYGRRFNRIRVPMFGRVNTSRVAGGLTFLAVLAWWMSRWAPIPAGEPEPDLWGLLEQGLNRPVLQVVDADLAIIVPPNPSIEVQQAAKAFPSYSDPLRGGLVAIASGRFDDAEKLLNQAAGGGADRIEEARAALDLYRGQYGDAAARYARMLKIQPRREDFLSHGALAAALAGDHVSAIAWAEQLLEQAQARGRTSQRTIEATNLLAVVHVVSGEFAEGLRASQTSVKLGKNAATLDTNDLAGMQYAFVANNAAVIHLFAGGDNAAGASPTNGFTHAKQLWLQRTSSVEAARLPNAARSALAEYNLAAAALYQSRYEQAGGLLIRSLAAWQAAAGPAEQAGTAVNINALAQVALISGRYDDAQLQLAKLAKISGRAGGDGAANLAIQSTAAQLDAALARYDRAVNTFHKLCHDAEHGAGGLSANHPYTAILNLRLADALLHAKRFSEAEAAAEECARILAHANLATSLYCADAYRIAGTAALRQGKHLPAERQFDRATKLLRPLDEATSSETDSETSGTAQPESIELVQLLAAEGELAGELQNYTAAADDYRSALRQLALLFESQASNHPLRAEYLHALAMLLVREEKFSEAKPLLDESLAIDRRALPAGHPATIAVMEDLAAVLEKTGAKSQADQLRAEIKRLHSH